MKGMGRVDRFRFSKIIDAPLRFVYDWCTDYREDDYKLTGAKTRRIMLEKTSRRVVYVNYQKGSTVGVSVGIVTLSPPNRWHYDSIGDQRNVTGDYHLRRIGSARVKLEMRFKRTWKATHAPSRSEFTHHIDEAWATYAAAIERSYRKRSN